MTVKNSTWSGFGSALVGVSLLFVSVAGVADSHDGLYKRIGAQERIATVVDGFLGKVGADDRANGRFANTDMPKLKALLIDQVCEATGGRASTRARACSTPTRG